METTGPTDLPPPARWPYAAPALALAQGLLLWSLYEAARSERWPATDPRAMLPLTLIAAMLPVTLQLLWPFLGQRLLQTTVALGSLFVGVAGALYGAAHLSLTERGDAGGMVAGFVLPLIFAWMLAMPLLKLRLTGGRWTAPYPLLFDLTWRGALTLAESALFTGIFWLTVGLAAALFKMLGIDAVGDFVTDPRFAIPATTIVGTAAIHLVGASAGMVDALLRQLLNVLKWLLPLAGVVVVAFSLALLPALPTLFAEGRKTIEAVWLLWLVALTVLLLNAAWQTGERPPGYGRLIEQALRCVPPLLLVVAATAVYSIGLRIATTGLTPTRYWGLVAAAVALAYASGYTLAAWSPGAWFARVGRVNVVIAVALLAVSLTSLTPLADPLRLSIASQAQRAIAASDERIRDGALRFLGREAGASGRARLDELGRLPDAAGGSAALRAAVPRARRAGGSPGQRFEDWLARIDAVPAGAALDPALVDALRATHAAEGPRFAALDRAVVLQVDLDGDGRPDALLQETTGLAGFWLFSREADGRWTLRSQGRTYGILDPATLAALRGGDVAAVAPRLQELRAGAARLTLVPAGAR